VLIGNFIPASASENVHVQLASERTEGRFFQCFLRLYSAVVVAGDERDPGLNLQHAENAWNAATQAVSATPKHLLRQILERLKGADYFGGACKI
jgi:hypothetical protein